MKESLSRETERVDDILLLIAHMQRMKLAELLYKHFPRNGNREGLSLEWVTVIWLTHFLSQANHRMKRVQEWADTAAGNVAWMWRQLHACTGYFKYPFY